MNKSELHVGDVVSTIKGEGVVTNVYYSSVEVKLYFNRGTYLFNKDSVWKWR